MILATGWPVIVCSRRWTVSPSTTVVWPLWWWSPMRWARSGRTRSAFIPAWAGHTSVPGSADAIRGRLRVDPDPPHWVIGGFSYGGTCAIQMATNYPSVYPKLRGHLRPARTDPRVAAAADREQPVRRGPCPVHRDQLHRPAGEEELPGPSGWFSVRSPGTPSTVLSCGWMFGVAKGAGMDVRFWHRPGDAHDWNTCVTGAHPRDALDGSTTEYHPMIRGPGVASGPSRVGTLATSACAPGIDTGGDRPAG